MKNTGMHLLFYTRLLLYFTAICVPLIYPVIVVPFDITGYAFWFFIIPALVLFCYYFSPPRLKLYIWLLSATGGLLLAVIIIFGVIWDAFFHFCYGVAAFTLTALIFKTQGRGRTIAVFEIFFLASIYYRIISFSRSSENFAELSKGITPFVLLILFSAFLIHGVVLYLSAFLKGLKKISLREVLLFFLCIIPFSVLIAFAFPIGYVDYDAVLNTLYEDIHPDMSPLNEIGKGFPEGRLQGEKGKGKLEGLRPDMWFNSQGKNRGTKQYAVMVIASQSEPIYAAEAYYGNFDRLRGLLYSEDEPLNELRSLHLLDTWQNFNKENDAKRFAESILYFSTISSRATAYRPASIEPTILHREYFPFKFSYDTVSELSYTDKEDWQKIEGLNNKQKAQYAAYLKVPLEDETYKKFKTYVDKLIRPDMDYYERIEILLKSFSSYQYMIGFNDRVDVARIEHFLFDTKQGDCTEFSNSMAILARLAGIPSRVVVGYLASKELRTISHFKGLYFLQQKIEPLQEYPLEDLYLVTTAHHHSWTQLYIPGYGWIDFEATMYAIPPPQGLNPNDQDVVIPLIQEQKTVKKRTLIIPWKTIILILISLLFLTLISLYLFRYIKELYLLLLTRNHNIKGLRALQRLLLMKLALWGYEYKPPSQTISEYAEIYPDIAQFAKGYTTLRYCTTLSSTENSRQWHLLHTQYLRLITENKKPGIGNLCRSLFTLKGIFY